jgi:hypothetical protein
LREGGGKKRKNSKIRGAPGFDDRFFYEVENVPFYLFSTSTSIAHSFIPIHYDQNVTIEQKLSFISSFTRT